MENGDSKAGSGRICRFSAGETIFNAGEDADGVFIVMEGEVELLIDDTVIGEEQAGGIIGEMALIEESRRSATARAKTDVTLHQINKDQFLSMVEQSPAFVLHLMRVMASRVRATNQLLLRNRESD